MKHLLKHFKDLSIHPKNAAELKGLILQLAVQGKLTANWRLENPDIESATVLLERVQVEKARLLKGKKIRKDKKLAKITNEEIPFELPVSWTWCRLQDYLDVRDGTHDTPKYVDKGIPLVTSKNLYTKKLDLSNIKFISEEDHIEISKRSKVERDDILFAMIGSIGNPVIVDIEPNFSIKNVALIKYYLRHLCEPHFILSFLEYATKDFIANSDGAVQSFVSLTKLRMKELPLPPLEEQKAIVSTVNTLFAEVEQLEQLTKERIQLKEDFVQSALKRLVVQTRYSASVQETNGEWAFLQQHFPAFFTELPNIKKLRESILQLAVQGKLTTHWRKDNPDTEDALVLLERIKAEKAQLVKAKKIKKKKDLASITDEEMTFKIPNTWEWSKVGEITNVKVGATPSKQNQGYWGGDIPWISSGEVANNFIYEVKGRITKLGFDSTSLVKYPIGTVLIAMIGQGKTRGQTSILKVEATTNQNVSGMMIFHKYLLSEYLWYFFLSRYETTRSGAVGGNQPALNSIKISNTVIPLPPVKEQQAIVEKVNTLMALCDQLEQEIHNSKATQEDWMKSSLREVFVESSANKEPKSYKIDGGLSMVAEP